MYFKNFGYKDMIQNIKRNICVNFPQTLRSYGFYGKAFFLSFYGLKTIFWSDSHLYCNAISVAIVWKKWSWQNAFDKKCDSASIVSKFQISKMNSICLWTLSLLKPTQYVGNYHGVSTLLCYIFWLYVSIICVN